MKGSGNLKALDTRHTFGRGSNILQSEVDEEVDVIMRYLRTKKQTYTINKFVLEQVIAELGETMVSEIMEERKEKEWIK